MDEILRPTPLCLKQPQVETCLMKIFKQKSVYPTNKTFPTRKKSWIKRKIIGRFSKKCGFPCFFCKFGVFFIAMLCFFVSFFFGDSFLEPKKRQQKNPPARKSTTKTGWSHRRGRVAWILFLEIARSEGTDGLVDSYIGIWEDEFFATIFFRLHGQNNLSEGELLASFIREDTSFLSSLP